jgi:hypothetical protein
MKGLYHVTMPPTLCANAIWILPSPSGSPSGWTSRPGTSSGSSVRIANCQNLGRSSLGREKLKPLLQ